MKNEILLIDRVSVTLEYDWIFLGGTAGNSHSEKFSCQFPVHGIQ